MRGESRQEITLEPYGEPLSHDIHPEYINVSRDREAAFTENYDDAIKAVRIFMLYLPFSYDKCWVLANGARARIRCALSTLRYQT